MCSVGGIVVCGGGIVGCGGGVVGCGGGIVGCGGGVVVCVCVVGGELYLTHSKVSKQRRDTQSHPQKSPRNVALFPGPLAHLQPVVQKARPSAAAPCSGVLGLGGS